MGNVGGLKTITTELGNKVTVATRETFNEPLATIYTVKTFQNKEKDIVFQFRIHTLRKQLTDPKLEEKIEKLEPDESMHLKDL